MVRSRLRLAAGVCVLAAGLLMCGGAVAVADPGLGGSAPNGDDGTSDPVQGGPTAGGPVGNVTDTVRETVQGVTGTPGSGAQPGQQPSTGATSTLGSGRQPGQQPSTGASTVGSGRQPGQQPSAGAKSPQKEAGGTDTTGEKEDAGLVAAVPNPVAAVPNPVAAVPNVVAPVTDAVAPVIDAVAPVTNAVAPVTDVVTPVTNAVAPIFDVIATIQGLPTSVANAVIPLTQSPSDLASLFGIAGVQPVVDELGGIDGPGLSTGAGTSVVWQWPLGLPLAGFPGMPLAGYAAGVAPLDVIALGRASSLSGMAPLAPNGATPMGVPSQSFLQHLCELLIRVSLWALAVAALPGVGGLLILTAAGMRIGYRQAKAGFAVRPAGIARFAPPGRLLSVVRSGSSVGVRPRALRVFHPGALSARWLPD